MAFSVQQITSNSSLSSSHCHSKSIRTLLGVTFVQNGVNFTQSYI